MLHSCVAPEPRAEAEHSSQKPVCESIRDPQGRCSVPFLCLAKPLFCLQAQLFSWAPSCYCLKFATFFLLAGSNYCKRLWVSGVFIITWYLPSPVFALFLHAVSFPSSWSAWEGAWGCRNSGRVGSPHWGPTLPVPLPQTGLKAPDTPEWGGTLFLSAFSPFCLIWLARVKVTLSVQVTTF